TFMEYLNLEQSDRHDAVNHHVVPVVGGTGVDQAYVPVQVFGDVPPLGTESVEFDRVEDLSPGFVGTHVLGPTVAPELQVDQAGGDGLLLVTFVDGPADEPVRLGVHPDAPGDAVGRPQRS